MSNIFLETSYTKCGGDASPRPNYRKSKLSIPPDQQSETLCSLFLLYVQMEVYETVLKIKCWPFTLTLFGSFSRNKEMSGTNLLASFSAWFLKKNIFHVTFY